MITRGPDSDFPSSPPLRLLRVIYSPCDDARPNAAGIFERRQFENVERGGGEVKNDRVGRGWMKFHFDVINSAYGAFAKKIFGIFSIRNRGRPLFLLPPPSPPSCFGSRGLKELFIFLLRRENNSAGELGCSFSPPPGGEGSGYQPEFYSRISMGKHWPCRLLPTSEGHRSNLNL